MPPSNDGGNIAGCEPTHASKTLTIPIMGHEASGAGALLDALKPGMSVFVPGSSGEPTTALQALAEHPERCAGVHFITSFVPGINTFDLASLGPEARFTAIFMHPSLKEAAATNRVNFLDLPYSGIAAWLERHPVDVALVQVSSEAVSGQVSLGPAVEFTPIVLRRAAMKIAIRNRRTPWLPGSVHYSPGQFDLIFEADAALPNYSDPTLNDTYNRIGAHVARLIPEGATLQTGLGQAPAAVLNALQDHHGLNIRSGVISDSVLRLIDSGALSADGRIITGVAVGSEAFYRRLPEFPGIRYASVSETHAAAELAATEKLFAINSAIEVDLSGNLNAEFLQGRRISGRGGLPDFTRGGHASKGGASIIVLPATDGSGIHSRIVPRLEAAATVPGELVDYVITEYGCAELRNRGKQARREAMLAIAAPNLRDALR